MMPPQDKIAINNEVMVAVSNSALITPDGSFGMLRMWIDGCKRAGVKNFMVIAIDDAVRGRAWGGGGTVGVRGSGKLGGAHRVHGNDDMWTDGYCVKSFTL